MPGKVIELLMQTATTPELDATVTAWAVASEFEVADLRRVDAKLAALWGVAPGAHTTAVVTGAAGAGRGLVRWVDTVATDDRRMPVETPGPFGLEFFARDVDAVYAKLSAGAAFAALSAPATYDLRVIGSGTCRSFAARGPGDIWLFFTTMLEVPPPRELPTTPYFVSPVVNMPIATAERAPAVSVYRDLLGIPPRLDGQVQDASINAIMCAPADWGFHVTVFFIGDGRLCEHHVHPAARLSPASRDPAALRSGPAITTLLVDDLADIMARAAAAGHAVRGPLALAGTPYHGRHVGCMNGPNNEIIELVQA